MNIVVIQTAFPGDVILSTAIFEALKVKYPGSHAAAVVRPESVCLLRGNPFIDDIIPFDKYGDSGGISGIFRMARRLRGFDKAIIIQRHLRSGLIPFFARIPERTGFQNASARFLYTEQIRYDENLHEVRRCLALADIEDPEVIYRPRIFIDQSTFDWADLKLLESGIKSDFAVVAPGSVWKTKRYPHYDKLIDLIYDKFSIPVVLVGSREDTELSRLLVDSAAHLPLDLTGRTDLLQSAAVISKAKFVVSNDSAAAHLAAAVETPVAAIFGPTIAGFGFAPYSEKSVVIDIGPLYCRPCSRHGSKKCPEGHFRCMKELEPLKILVAVQSLIAGRTNNSLS